MTQVIRRKNIYKITYPNGKIYIGKDLIGEITYTGSINNELVESDFLAPEDRKSFTVTKEILWESFSAEDAEVSKLEVKYIRDFDPNNPKIGYNRWPKFQG